ncbi:hypothetical protein OCU04_001541 [Sclerotinia nivalis]|uniref:SnoaL-like domain-containing protein n=1 Tax=Sclerotinia nivalis TaxID=352851 RepID=A0A9X0AYC7_9HELO|nr:hypothetical protein OCU04_001541 [Sclerotinia nivalis]
MQFHKLLAVVFGLISSAITSSNYSACPNISPGPATLFQLAELLPISPLIDPIATENIRNTLALYAFAIDGRNWAAISRVFAPNARANYSAAIGILYGPEEIANYISTSLASFAGTQHRYGTQYITICSPSSAISVTYFQASHFFLPDVAPVVEDGTHTLFATGRYEDTWIRENNGTWKIGNRNLVFMGPLILDTA